jgi:hypothetical protein
MDMGVYWTSTTSMEFPERNILVNLGAGMLDWYFPKDRRTYEFMDFYAWCVRAGE